MQVQLHYDMKCQFEIGSPVVIHRHNERTDEATTTITNGGNNHHRETNMSQTKTLTAGNETLAQQFGSGSSSSSSKFTVTRVAEPIASASAATDDTLNSDMEQPCSSLDSSTSDSFKNVDFADSAPKRFGAKNRLISVDSGFESIGKMRIIGSASMMANDADTTLAEDPAGNGNDADEDEDEDDDEGEDNDDEVIEGGDMLKALQDENANASAAKLNNNNDNVNKTDATLKTASTSTTIAAKPDDNCDIRHKITTTTTNGGNVESEFVTASAQVKKNRTTAITSLDNTTEPQTEVQVAAATVSILDPMLINKSDGLQDVLYYIDENGSPKIREKFTKATKKSKKVRRSEAVKKKKQLTYGTEADIADAHAFDEKTPTCVSFSRICKRFKNSFRKFLLCQMIQNENRKRELSSNNLGIMISTTNGFQ